MHRRARRGLIAWIVAALCIGAMSVSVAADSSGWTAGPGATGDATYTGFIDAPAASASVPTGSFVVTGWFVDTSAQGWAGADDIQVFQGTMDGGGKLLAKAALGQSRPDVAAALSNPFWAASGYSAVVPAASLSPGAQSLSVYAHTPGKGWWYEQLQINVASDATASAPPTGAAPAPAQAAAALAVGFDKPKDGEVVYTKSDYEIIGYAVDTSATPNQGVAGSGIDRVQVYLGNERDAGGIFLGEAELGFANSTPLQRFGGQFVSAGWRLTFKPTKFKANTYLLFAYARSAVTGKEDVAQRYFAIHE